MAFSTSPASPEGRAMDREDYRALFNPRAVAVVGASNNPLKLGYSVYENLKDYPKGNVYPINPRERVVQGSLAYPSLHEVPEPLDLVVITVPREHVEELVRQAGEKGARVAVVITAGFSEVGGEGRELERKLIATARKAGVRVLGPNCVGVMNLKAGLNATFIKAPRPGGMAFLSQSGALAAGLVYRMDSQGGGLSKFASLGNMADLVFEDFLPHLSRDPDVKTIGLYVEGVRSGRAYMEALREATRHKPTVVLKGGKTPQGARAAGSHTGSLAGEYRVFRAATLQSGALVAEGLEEFLAMAQGLEQPLPRGRRVAVLTNAGGPGVLMVDELVRRGLEIAHLSPETVDALRSFLPPAASTANPVDMVASARGNDYWRATRLILQDPGVDMLIAISVVPTFAGIRGVDHADGIRRGVRDARVEKPVLALFMAGRVAEEARLALASNGVPVFETPGEAAAAAWALAWRAGLVGAWPGAPVP